MRKGADREGKMKEGGEVLLRMLSCPSRKGPLSSTYPTPWFYERGNRGSEKCDSLPKITQLLCD